MIIPRSIRQRFRWSALPKRRQRQIVLAAGAATTVATFEYKFQECIDVVGNPSKVSSPHRLFWLRVLYGRMRSRWMGSLSEVHLPVTLRAPVFQMFAWIYGADLDEVRYPLDSFHTFQDFFCRRLVDKARPIADVPRGLVSPVDGKVVATGVIDSSDARVEQVKGATYHVPAFLGLDPFEAPDRDTSAGSTIRYIVLYLSPADYHRVHTPCELTFKNGRHFAGELLPMRDSILTNFSDIFTVSERVVLSGKWQFGQLHCALVGAANVGNIFLAFDPKLMTNRFRDIVTHCGGDVSAKIYHKNVGLSPGDALGGFRMGSTVVLVLDTPASFEWKVSVGDDVRVGRPLGEA
eukprot:TRINITY_DN93209_c0_g1_i1.p1 TRINITY_DN93209_c0_g1~~TRINITY_DN93209_c0_g1_i1.p1  ORF type:complete len:376 (+),score=14.88 TRINITY_DN93209_c0_g1_i1:82-1128(+)